jgi:hypothetical protein
LCKRTFMFEIFKKAIHFFSILSSIEGKLHSSEMNLLRSGYNFFLAMKVQWLTLASISPSHGQWNLQICVEAIMVAITSFSFGLYGLRRWSARNQMPQTQNACLLPMRPSGQSGQSLRSQWSRSVTAAQTT